MLDIYLQKYRNKGILIDTNLLLLLFVGQLSENFIQKFQRTNQYTKSDYQILLNFIDKFDKVVTTPNIMTEMSNLGSNSMYGDKLKNFFSKFVDNFVIISEQYLESKIIANSENIDEFGLTDIGIVLVAKDNYLILTDDLDLSMFALRNNVAAVNFNHIRHIV